MNLGLPSYKAACKFMEREGHLGPIIVASEHLHTKITSALTMLYSHNV